MSFNVRLEARDGAQAAEDRDFIRALGRRSAVSSVGELRHAGGSAAALAFDRLCEIVESQSHVTFIAQRAQERIGFLLLLDDLPDEVTMLEQGFIAYMAVEEEYRRAGVGAALLAAAEDEARRRGLPHISLMVTEQNRAARGLYERAGYSTERRLLCKAL